MAFELDPLIDEWISVPQSITREHMNCRCTWADFSRSIELAEQRIRIMSRSTIVDRTLHMRRLFVNDKGVGETYCGKLSHVERQCGGFMDVVFLCFDNAVCVPVPLYGDDAQIKTGMHTLEAFVRTYEPDITEVINGEHVDIALAELIDRCKNMIGLTFAVDVSGQKIKPRYLTETPRWITLYAFDRSHLNASSW